MKYEAHITIEPISGTQREYFFAFLCGQVGFKPAHLLMKKSRTATPERSDRDAFCTGHDEDLETILTRTKSLVSQLAAAGFEVWRWKIEEILYDVRLSH